MKKVTMKRLILILFVLLFLLNACSVSLKELPEPEEHSDTEQTDSSYYNNGSETVETVTRFNRSFKFFFDFPGKILLGSGQSADTYINEATGNLNHRITDPFYQYKLTGDLLAFQKTTVYVIGERIYTRMINQIRQDGSRFLTPVYEIYSEDFDGQNRKFHYRSYNKIDFIGQGDNCIYLNVMETDEYDVRTFHSVCFDCVTNEITELHDREGNDILFEMITDLGEGCPKYALIGDMVYRFSSDFSEKTLVPDMDSPSGFMDTDYLYYRTSEGGLSRIALDGTGAAMPLHDSVGNFFCTDQHIYYTEYDENSVIEGVMQPHTKLGSTPTYDQAKGKIYCMNKDGTEKRLIRDDFKKWAFYEIFISGDYLYACAYFYDDLLEGKSLSESNKFLRVRIDSPDAEWEILGDGALNTLTMTKG